MSGQPWWLQAYILLAAFAFGLMLATPQKKDAKVGWFANLFWSAVLAAVWPITGLVIGGVMLSEIIP